MKHEKGKVNRDIELKKFHKGDLFTLDVAYPPIGLPVIILGKWKYWGRKWYNPISWFKKRTAYWYKDIEEETEVNEVD